MGRGGASHLWDADPGPAALTGGALGGGRARAEAVAAKPRRPALRVGHAGPARSLYAGLASGALAVLGAGGANSGDAGQSGQGRAE